ncbi:hypothetical protein EV702DRAFT_714348 [Suillus placidus]|uniref:Uncharacterized protein n=1 Tax=Suillus placidus TaxID=48579 RepID=A0A9P6ZJE8_9AGAM|nr:hypothetical protein EV702DRAFT_714348 [Suillus placidus]
MDSLRHAYWQPYHLLLRLLMIDFLLSGFTGVSSILISHQTVFLSIYPSIIFDTGFDCQYGNAAALVCSTTKGQVTCDQIRARAMRSLRG